MKRTLVLAALAGLLPLSPAAARTEASATLDGFPAATGTLPEQLDGDQRTGYRAVFAAIHDKRWQDAQLALDAMKPGPLHAIARAELFTAKDSPRVEADALLPLIAAAPELPEAEQLARMARNRGATELPTIPSEQRLVWLGSAPVRRRAKPTLADAVAMRMTLDMQPFIKADDGVNAEALLGRTAGLSPEATTEWQQRVGWIYFTSGWDADARRMAAQAQRGSGEWAVQAWWLDGLAAWRQHDYAAAGAAFETVAGRASDIELRAAGLYWAGRAELADGHPERVETQLRGAAQYRESFYGQLAREALGIRDRTSPTSSDGDDDWRALSGRPNVRVAAALVEIGETGLADEVLRHQAKIGDASDYPALVRLTQRLELPETQIWLAHNGPAGAKAPVMARYPAPSWTPDGGWRVDKALVYAHALQESGFRRQAVSRTGAYGLMQIMPAAAVDFVRARGLPLAKEALSDPRINIAVGQTTLERLRDQSVTGGLLPKVIAAYNAGPGPVAQWNAQSRDGGDPLFYIESLPYWETRGYISTVLRNYWMYEAEAGRAASPSRAALAQGLWPRFPGLAGASGVKLSTAIAPPLPKQPVITTPVPAPFSPPDQPQGGGSDDDPDQTTLASNAR